MFYFIPAWRNLQVSKFDETLSQIKLFHTYGEPYRLWITSYMPYLRTFLIFEGLASTQYRSIFDEMQNIHQEYENKIDIYELNWPADVSFVYSQFSIFVLRGNRRYASVYLDSLNNIQHIDIFKDEEEIAKKIFFDDRGFISSIEYFKNHSLHKKEFFNELYQLQFSVDYTNNQQVTLGEENRMKYHREQFPSLNDFIKTVFHTYFKAINDQDVFVVALHDELLQQVEMNQFKNNRLVSSVFSKREVDCQSPIVRQFLEQTDLILVDQLQIAEKLSSLDFKRPIQALTPYDTVLRLGESQQVGYYQLHYVWHEEMNVRQSDLLKRLIQWYQQYDWRFTVHCMQDFQVSVLKRELIEILSEQFDIELSVIQELIQPEYQQAENECIDDLANVAYLKKLQQIEKIIASITFETFSSKEDLLASLLHTRLIIDLGAQPDVLTQICGISSGIPIINRAETGYVVHQKNGWLIKDETELDQVLHYYLTGLKHWNEALVYSMEQLNKYTDGAIIRQWKEWLSIG